MSLDFDYFQKKLEEEKTRIEAELATVAERNPDAPQDWNVKYPDMNVMPAAKEEIADQEEEYENRASFELGIETQLKAVIEALERINHGSFGKCAVDGKDIDEARLRANPAAATCMEHAERGL